MLEVGGSISPAGTKAAVGNQLQQRQSAISYSNSKINTEAAELLATGYWLLATGFRLSATGYWLPAKRRQRKLGYGYRLPALAKGNTRKAAFGVPHESPRADVRDSYL
jgi:hypothetical protein